MARLVFTVDGIGGPERVDSYLASLPDMPSRSRIKEIIASGCVLLDGAPAKASDKVRPGSVIDMDLPDAAPYKLAAEDIPLDVIYDDSDLIVFNKPPGLLTHPTPSCSTGTLVNALLYHCNDLSGIGGEQKPGIVHRLDRLTSGVMVAAKNDRAHQSLAAQFKDHTISRRYLAVVYGEMERIGGVIESEISRDPKRRLRMTGRGGSGKARRAVTRYEVRARAHGFSLVFLTLETGRTHQIRVHMSENNHPVVGDPLYGKGREPSPRLDTAVRAAVNKMERQALHAFHLGFAHPEDGREMVFEAPPPRDIFELAEALGMSDFLPARRATKGTDQ